MTDQAKDIVTGIIITITFTTFVIVMIIDFYEKRKQDRELKSLLTMPNDGTPYTKTINPIVKVRVISSKIISNASHLNNRKR